MDDIEELRAQAEEDRRKAYERAETDYTTAIAAIKKIKEMLRRRDPLGAVPVKAEEVLANSTNSATSEKANWPGLRTAIRGIIKERPDQFTLNSVMDDLARYRPNTAKRIAVSAELWRMNRKGEIAIVERGSGNKPNVYTLKSESEKAEPKEAELSFVMKKAAS